jgi:DNA-binding PadR family transcriptional regulator
MGLPWLQRALEVFPKMFYFFPTMPPHTVSVGGESIQLTEPMDGVLWLLETLAKEDGRNYCLQHELEDLLAWWYPPKPNRTSPYNFSKSINKLVRQGLIKSNRYEGNKRFNRLELTPTGRALLELVKTERTNPLQALAARGHERELQAAVLALEKIARLTWAEMRKHSRRPGNSLG